MSGTSNQQNGVEISLQSALIQATENGDLCEVKRLINDGLAVDEVDNRDMNALFLAVRRRNINLVRLLVEEGKAFVNARDLYGRTPLFYAITQSKEIAGYIIKKGADVNLKDFSNRSALSFFVENCMMTENIPLSSLLSSKSDEFEMLKDPAADVKHEVIKTILNIVFCKLPLLCASSKIPTDKMNQETTKIRENFMPTDLEVVSTYFEENDTTKKAIVDDISRLCKEEKFVEVIASLVKIGADPNFADSHGNTALHYAAFLPFLGVSTEVIMSMFGQLESYGLTLNTRNNQNQTPLLFCLSGSIRHLEEQKLTAVKTLVEVCKFLVTRGSSLEETTQKGESVFHLVIKLFQQGFEMPEQRVRPEVVHEMMKLLHLFSSDRLIKGNTVNNGDCRLNSPLHFWATLAMPFSANYSSNDFFEATLRTILDYLLNLGAALNARNEDEETPLHMCKTFSAVTLLLTKGANPHDVSSTGSSSIFSAVNNCKIQQSLVRGFTEGADVIITNDTGKTALFYAVQQNKNKVVVRALIDAGADVNITDNEGKTVMFYAVQLSSNESVVRALIDAGADVNVTDNEGKTVMFYAVQLSSNESVVRALIDACADVNVTDNEGKTVMFYAVQLSNNEVVVRALIDAGADVNATDENGKTALFYAARKTNEEMVEKLIQCGADINAVDKDGKSPLFFVNSKNCSIARMLIEDGGTQVDVRDHYGRTPLFYAMTQSLFLAKYLLDKGTTLHLNENCNVLTFFIEICIFSSSNNTPNLQDGLNLLTERKEVERKHILAAIASVAFCKTLCFKPGSCDIDVDTLCKLMTLAKENTSTFKMLLPVGKNKIISEISNIIHEERHDKPLIESRDAIELARLFFQLNANPNTRDSDGNTALHHATQLAFHGVTRKSIIEIMCELQRLNVSFHITNHQNETQLLYCLTRTMEEVYRKENPWPAIKTQAAVCRFLVEHGSSVEAKTGRGETVLHLAIKLLQQGFSKRNSELRKEISDVALELLKVISCAFRKQNVSTDIQDNSGSTALHLWAKLQLAADQHYFSNITTEYTFNTLLKYILDLLLQNKEHLNSRNENGETPLHVCRTWAAVELLLNAGANPNEVTSSGCSPLHLAARNNVSVHDRGSLYPDISLAPDEFWKKVINKGLDPWTVDIHDESLLSVLMGSESHDLAKALVDVACDDIKVRPLILFCLLNTICRDHLPNAHWKRDAAEKILRSPYCPVNGNDREDSPLHHCCRNIVEASKSLSIDEIKTTVHWSMVKLLRSFGADYSIPDATNQSCIDMAKKCPALKDLLMEPIDIDKFPVLIKSWKSVSKTHERCLAKVARHLQSKQLESYWYFQDDFQRGLLSDVFAGINEKDGREVAIKRTLKRGIQRSQDEREITSLTALTDCEQVVRYFQFVEDKLFFYIVLELMDGNLEDLLNKSVTIKEREELCQDVVKGLSYVHERGYLHHDLNPTNILFKHTPKLCLKIADFGLRHCYDSTQLKTVYGTSVGKRCWIAPEVLKKAPKDQDSKASDMFSCGLVLHYILSGKKHPFSPEDCANKSNIQICNETETNVYYGSKKGWDYFLSPEASNLINQLLESEAGKRPIAKVALVHPLFWTKKEKMDFITAVGNQPEFEYPRAKRTPSLTAVETDLENRFGTIVKYVDWNDPGYVHMPAIYAEMTRRRRAYDTASVVDLVRFIRNAYVHVHELPKSIQKLLLENFVFLEYFPKLVMEVYKVVTTHGWNRSK